MTADVTQDRRVTVAAHGTPTDLVDGSRLFWALPSRPVHEGLGYRGFRANGFSRTGYKVMRSLPHAFHTAQFRITSSRQSRERTSLHQRIVGRLQKLGFQGMQKSIVM